MIRDVLISTGWPPEVANAWLTFMLLLFTCAGGTLAVAAQWRDFPENDEP